MRTRPNITPRPTIDVVEETDVGPGGTPGYPIQVVVTDRVYTQEMPALAGTDGSLNVSSSETQALIQPDNLRKEAVLWCETSGVYFGVNKSAVQMGQSAHLPAGGSATIRHRGAIYVRSDGATPALVSYITERYGE